MGMVTRHVCRCLILIPSGEPPTFYFKLIKSFVPTMAGSRPPLPTFPTIDALAEREDRMVAAELAAHVADDPLTHRELEVLRLITEGNSNKLIGDQLSISEERVKVHVSNILSKLGANDRTHTVTIGVKRGIIVL
jgi:DNA-binding CsgD family transcriptional regulator